jgi:hypothetical protein
MFQLPTPPMFLRMTTGGLQFWTDFVYRDGFRIQQHALSGRWRLIDSNHFRVVSGTREECQSELDKVCSIESWKQIDAPFVVLIHGLMRSANCMSPLKQHLRNRGADYVTRYSYASSRASILSHASALIEYIESLPPRSRLSFVGHSMGNIVLRAAIGHWSREGDPLGVLNRMHRVVMLGPPNQGAVIAKRLAHTGVFGLINGPGGLELGVRWNELESRLGTPPCPFAILAGDLSSLWVHNPLVGPASDLLVRVEETKLDGCTELVTIPVPHTTLMSHPKAMEYISQFLLG